MSLYCGYNHAIWNFNAYFSTNEHSKCLLSSFPWYWHLISGFNPLHKWVTNSNLVDAGAGVPDLLTSPTLDSVRSREAVSMGGAPWCKCELQSLVGRKVWTVYSEHYYVRLARYDRTGMTQREAELCGLSTHQCLPNSLAKVASQVVQCTVICKQYAEVAD